MYMDKGKISVPSHHIWMYWYDMHKDKNFYISSLTQRTINLQTADILGVFLQTYQLSH